MIGAPILNNCAIYGASNYTNNWLGINYLVILAGLFLVAFIYMISKFMPANMKARIVSMTRVELVELFTSALIIVVLLFFASAVCNISSTLSYQATGSSYSPFIYSDFYIGNLTFNTGLKLLSQVYTLSIGFAIDGRLLTAVSNFLSTLVSAPEQSGIIQITFPFGYDLGVLYNSVSTLFLDFLAPIVVAALGTLFVQWISIPLIQATAFVVVLPIAIIMRSLPLSGAGGGLRSASNAVLAIAVAAYLIYPLTISFDPCMISWIYGNSSCIAAPNYSAPYIPSYQLNTLTPGVLSAISSNSTARTGIAGISTPMINSFIGTAFDAGIGAVDPYTLLSSTQTMIIYISQFIFQGVILFALDITITIGFAFGLSKALDAGLGGQSPFWSNI
jgi:hypothetical protein